MSRTAPAARTINSPSRAAIRGRPRSPAEPGEIETERGDHRGHHSQQARRATARSRTRLIALVSSIASIMQPGQQFALRRTIFWPATGRLTTVSSTCVSGQSFLQLRSFAVEHVVGRGQPARRCRRRRLRAAAIGGGADQNQRGVGENVVADWGEVLGGALDPEDLGKLALGGFTPWPPTSSARPSRPERRPRWRRTTRVSDVAGLKARLGLQGSSTCASRGRTAGR